MWNKYNCFLSKSETEFVAKYLESAGESLNIQEFELAYMLELYGSFHLPSALVKS